ncbi:hypothetical protein [Maritimibacter sp. UBA3975]|uniref:hypothetical protein n=1 Tax=Maritimibacter sp. UBA3975 TaxID=1946833 RepID=UPI000C0B30ED|nr:hypothetical protein [Maritimibacter sp. UBA3975]MAM60392.1 hypothetical protein [Maritimibacter sp.]|tara:strand:+ start:7401 stop:7949 length:549 start_codon:yes stop_codon:yes gene_type:complete
MTRDLEIIAAPPSFRTMRLIGAVFLALGLIGIAQVAMTDPEALWRTPTGALLAVPVLLGVMLGWVGLTETHMRRRLAHLSAEGAQVGVHARLPWDRIVRIERRGSGTYETLTLFPAGKRELRRPIPIGRAENAPDMIVGEVLAFMEQAGVTATLAQKGARDVWEVAQDETAPEPTRSDQVSA